MKSVIRLAFRAITGTGILVMLFLVAILLAGGVSAAPYAAMIMDARSGQILHQENANQRLHPASLTKMMTVYVAIQAVENGEIDWDTRVKISQFAASEPPSKLHLKPGSRVKLRYLIRAAAVRSANDAATAIAEAISGSESAFARRMNRTAQAMGLTQTHFKNAHGLTQSGHLSTARDMTVLGRHVIYDYPEYFHLYSKMTAQVGGTSVRNTNRNFLRQYNGADGIKTGFTNKAGFNLTATAKRGNKRIIVTVFGGRSGQSRNAHVAKLMNSGFEQARDKVALRPPPLPEIPFGRVSRVNMNVEKASRRLKRPARGETSAYQNAVPSDQRDVHSQGDADPSEALARAEEEVRVSGDQPVIVKRASYSRPMRRPVSSQDTQRNERINGIHLGDFTTSTEADRHLVRVTLLEFGALSVARKSIERQRTGFAAGFTGLTPDVARKICIRLNAQNVGCKLTRVED